MLTVWLNRPRATTAPTRPTRRSTPAPGSTIRRTPVSVSRVTTSEPTTVINETPVEVLDRGVGPDAPTARAPVRGGLGQGRPAPDHPGRRRRGHRHLGAVPPDRAAARGHPVDPDRRLHRPGAQPGGQLPPTAPLPAGARPSACVFAMAALIFAGLLGLFGYPLVNSLTHVAKQPADHGQPGAEGPRLAGPHPPALPPAVVGPEERPQARDGGQEPEQTGPAARAPTWPAPPSRPSSSLFTIAFLSLFMLLEAPRIRAGLLGTMRPDRRADRRGHRPPGLPPGHRLRAGHRRPVGHVRRGRPGHHAHPRGALRRAHRPVGGPGGHDPAGRGLDRRHPERAPGLPPHAHVRAWSC